MRILPSVSGIEISETRRKKVIENITNSFFYSAISRRIVNLERVESTDKKFNERFGRLGLSHIVDRIWFVDPPSPIIRTYYSYDSLGETEGKEIGLSETKMVVDSILANAATKENIVKRGEELEEEDLNRAIAVMKEREQACESILISIPDVKEFWMKEFKLFKIYRSSNIFGLEGYYDGIPVYWSNALSEGTTITLNKNVGTLLIKKELTAQLLNIMPTEYGEILKALPQFRREDLKEKIRLTADELILFESRYKNAVIVLQANA